MNTKAKILQIIYSTFAEWAQDSAWACKKGCSSCCSQNVTITALEGEHILRHVVALNKEQWLAGKLEDEGHRHRPKYSINSLARACMAGKEVAEEEPATAATCPFLENDICTIYPARPFSCRCFLSLHTCSPTRPALISDSYLAASMAVNQLIEHLGQRQYWGNMLDVLSSLLDISTYETIANHLPDRVATITAARLHTLSAQPLPGFMLNQEDYEQVAPLIEQIFKQQVGGRTVEDILNGKPES